MRTRKLYLLGAIMVILSGAGGATGGYLASQLHTAGNSAAASNAAHARLTSQGSGGSIPALVKSIGPAVVSITTKSTTYSFFGGPVAQEGAGTGMILTGNGYILTNNHVLPIGGGSMTVTTESGKQYAARVVAANTQQDLALVKINASGLPTVTLGDSSAEGVGDGVIAIGNALGQFQNSVVSGIISGMDRAVVASDGGSMNGGESLSGLLQTDAAINPGDSGGPLVDVATGTVIGMDTATSSDGQDISFAIPINQAKSFVAPYVNIKSV